MQYNTIQNIEMDVLFRLSASGWISTVIVTVVYSMKQSHSSMYIVCI